MRCCPPPGPELHFHVGGRGALVREGGFAQCYRSRNSYLWLVRMLLIYPYLHLYVSFVCASVARKSARPRQPDKTNERARSICTGAGSGRISRIRFVLAHVRQPLGPKEVGHPFLMHLISMDEPEVRRVGLASFALRPPPGPELHFSFGGGGSSGSGGGLCAMLG